MSRINLNVARAFVGCHANICLRDGSVLVNVYVVDVGLDGEFGQRSLEVRRPHRQDIRVNLKDVRWVERLNPHFLAAGEDAR